MKKIIKIMIGLFIFVPFLNVFALSCYSEVIDENTGNFKCTGISGDKLSFVDSTSGTDYGEYFKYTISDGEAQISVNKSLTFSSNLKTGIVKVTDAEKDAFITIANSQYVEPTTTSATTTTTTTNANTKTLTITLDPNDNTNNLETKTCTVSGNETTCYITLPKISKSTFNGWGTAKTCKEGNSGTIKVEKDMTYYACYTDNEQTNEKETILLKTLSLTDKDTDESIDFGTFSIKKTEYSFKVLNSVENINVSASADEGIVIDVVGNENLKVGENEIKITLKKGDNLTNEYTLKVTRLNVGETINNINYLKTLVVGGYTINFDKNVFVYNLTIPSDVNKLQITAEAEDETLPKPEIVGNEELKDGSVISINITDENNETTTYSINITKESSVNYILIGAVAIIILLIVILVILIIIKSNKKKQNLKNNSKPQVLKNEKKQDNVEILNI